MVCIQRSLSKMWSLQSLPGLCKAANMTTLHQKSRLCATFSDAKRWWHPCGPLGSHNSSEACRTSHPTPQRLTHVWQSQRTSSTNFWYFYHPSTKSIFARLMRPCFDLLSTACCDPLSTLSHLSLPPTTPSLCINIACNITH